MAKNVEKVIEQKVMSDIINPKDTGFDFNSVINTLIQKMTQKKVSEMMTADTKSNTDDVLKMILILKLLNK